jgi:predicted  nucleic acid-binding Zn-ribbon protein
MIFCHCYRELVKELDDSEEQARRMRLELMKKDLWLGSMLHREVIIDTDLNERKQELAAGFAHVSAVRARIDRIRKERRALELMAQKHQFDSAVDTLKMQVNDVEQVSSALDNRVKSLHDTISAKVEDEVTAMRKSLQPGVAAGVETDAAADQAVSSAVQNLPVSAALLEVGAGNLRATRKA